MISALVISALYLLGTKLFYEYDQEVLVEEYQVPNAGHVLWYAAWPIIVLIAMVYGALDKDTSTDE